MDLELLRRTPHRRFDGQCDWRHKMWSTIVVMSFKELFDEAVRLEEVQPERALAAWQELATSNPTLSIFMRLARCAQNLGLTDEAEQSFKKALRIDGRTVLALTGLGMLAIDRRDYQAAEDYFERACALEEDSADSRDRLPIWLTFLGVALRNVGKNLEAEEAYRRAIRIDSKYEEAYFNLAVLLANDRPSEAKALLRRALELDPDYAVAHGELGWVLHRRRRHGRPRRNAEVEGHFRRAIELAPNDAWAHICLGTYLWGDVDSAVAEFQIARELEPNWTVPLWSLGNVYEILLEDFDLAQSFFEMALQLDADDVVTLTNFGRLCKKRGQFDRAREYLRRALVLNPRYDKARTLLSDIGAGP
jgi:tetratricopeptide (TPR) repeat protein